MGMSNQMKHIAILFLSLISLNFIFGQELSLVRPTNNFVSDNNNINFSWNANELSNPIYQIQISNNVNFTNLIYNEISFVSNVILNIDQSENQHLFWRVKDSLNNTYSNTRYLYLINLSSFNNVEVWLRSDSLIQSNDSISKWTNLGNANFTFLQNTDSRKPLLMQNVLNGYPSVFFSGGKELKGNKTVLTSAGLEFYSVLRPNIVSTDNKFVYDQGKLSQRGNGLILSESQLTTYMPTNYGGAINSSLGVFDYSILAETIDFSAQNLTVNINDNFSVNYPFTTNNFSNTTILSSNKFTLGGQAKSYDATRTFDGEMFEIILLKDQVFISELDKKIIPRYLHNKYSPYPNLGEDIIMDQYSFCDHQATLSPGNHFLNYSWSTGESSAGINVNAPGEYFVEVTDVFGYVLSDTILIKAPYTNFESSLLTCIGDTTFLYKNIGSSYSFLWNTFSTDSSLYITDPGTYSVTITDSFGCSITDEVTLLIDSFSFQSTLGLDRDFCLGSNLLFTTTSINNGPYEYLWSTGDTSLFIELNTPSDTQISIEVSDKYSCIAKDTIQVHVNNLIAPFVDFIADTTCFGIANNFISASTTSGSDSIIEYTWDFPDNTVSSGNANADYTHSNDNSFTVSLSIQTDSSCLNSISKDVYVHKLPVVDFVCGVICSGSSSSFSENASFLNNDSINIWNWSLNSMSLADSKNPDFVLSGVGVHDIKLIVGDVNNCIDSITKSIEVFPALTADFSFTNNCIGDLISFKDETQSLSIVDWNWAFNGFNSSALQNPKFQYNTVGMQTVNLAIENALGCKSNISKNVEISPQPIASFGFNKVCLTDTTLFFDNSTVLLDSIKSSVWSIDLNLFFQDSVKYVFSDEDDYSVHYSIKTQKECTDDTTIIVVINPLPNPSFDFTPDYGTAPLEVSFINETPDADTYSWSFGDNENSNDKNPKHTYVDNGIYNVTLETTNSFNCKNTRTQQMAIIPSELDLELKKLDLKITQNGNNNIVNANVLLSNVGSRKIKNADLILRLDNGDVLVQKWTGDLPVGKIIDYSFDSYFIITDLANSKYICVEAIAVNDGTELNMNNNKTCSLIDGIIQFSKPYPNPAKNFVNLDVVTKNKGFCSVEVINMLGNILQANTEVILQKGYNQLQLETAKYESGKYFLKVTFLEEEYLYSFVLN